MKPRYILAVIFTGTITLLATAFYHWEIPARFKAHWTSQKNQILAVAIQTPNDDTNTHEAYRLIDVRNDVESLTVEHSQETNELIFFVNQNFEKAARLYEERLEIRKRRKPNKQYSPEDRKRLQEIHLEVYAYLKAINDQIEGATQPYLTNRGGSIGCGYYLMPHILKERLEVVPEGYYRFEKAIQPFLRKPGTRGGESRPK